MAASRTPWHGVKYAFGPGMDPRLKDGVRAHPGVLLWGSLFHAAVLTAFLVAGLVFSARTPRDGAAMVLSIVLGAGVLSGLYLLGRRWRSPALRAISLPDDYFSTTLVTVVLATALLALHAPRAIAIFAVSLTALIVYAPFGKIRHCVLFFVARTRYGLFIGRRGLFAARRPGA